MEFVIQVAHGDVQEGHTATLFSQYPSKNNNFKISKINIPWQLQELAKFYLFEDRLVVQLVQLVLVVMQVLHLAWHMLQIPPLK